VRSLVRAASLEVRYEAGRFGRGFKAEPKSPASVRVVPMCEQVRQAIGRQLPAGARPDDLVFPGPGGSNGIPRGARTPLSTHNLRRVYQAAVAAAGEDLAYLDLHGPHDLRHTFATWLEDAGLPSRVIDELMGHTGERPHGDTMEVRWAGSTGRRRRRCSLVSPRPWTNGSATQWQLLEICRATPKDGQRLRLDKPPRRLLSVATS
jgi:hypothetical protein